MTGSRPSDFEPWEDAAFSLCGGTKCPSPDVLLPALEGTLEEPALTRVRSHVSACAVCRELAAALEAAAEAGPTAEERARMHAKQPRRSRGASATYWPAAVAASLLLVLGAFWLSQFTEFRSFEPPSPTPTLSVRTQSQPQFVLPLHPPAVNLPDEPIVLRGGDARPFEAALIEAARPFRRGDYVTAAARMSALRRQYPDRPHPAFYEGVSLLLTEKPAEAAEPLEAARQLSERESALHAEASWYLAVAFERFGRRSDSIAILTDMCGDAGEMNEQACVALHRLLTPPR